MSPCSPYSPGGGGERRDPRLQDAAQEDERVLARDDEVEGGERAATVDDEADDHRQHVEAELLRRQRQVLDAHDLTGDQAHDAERRVPAAAAQAKGPLILRTQDDTRRRGRCINI